MLLMIVIILLMFTIIVVAHEWGHYITARKCGVLVHEFAVGMGPSIWSKTIGETMYSIRLLPIGGYCRMEEEVGESKNPRAMASKKPWQKLLIVSAGAIMNFILAWILFAILAGCSGKNSNIVQSVQAGTPAADAGIVAGDRIVAINGNKVKDSSAFSNYLTDEEAEYMLTIQRDGQTLELPVSTQVIEEGAAPRFGVIMKKIHFDLFYNIKMGFLLIISTIHMVWDSVIGLVSGVIGFDQVAGIVGVVDVGNQVWTESIQQGGLYVAILNMVKLAALLSTNLGVMNLLPLPALDGGRIFFILIEMIRGKAVSPEKENIVHFIGMVLLMLVTVVVLYNDLMRLKG